MTDVEPKATPPKAQQGATEPTEPVVPDGQQAPTSSRQVFGRVRRELADDELAHPGVQRLLLSMLERAEDEADALRAAKEQYWAAKAECDVLKERLKPRLILDLLLGVMTVVGGVMLGSASSLWASKPYGWVSLALGSVFVLAPMLGRWVRQ